MTKLNMLLRIQKDLFLLYVLVVFAIFFTSALFLFFFQENAEICLDRPRATDGRVSCASLSATATAANIGVESVTGAQCAQQKERQLLPSPLASRRLDLASADAAAASFGPVVATAATQRCATAKSAAAVDAATPRPSYIYLDSPLVTEISKEDVMEPETKEEDERHLSTSSPEVMSFLPVIAARSFFYA